MKYTSNDHITCPADVVAFAYHLTYDCRLGWHPDDDITDNNVLEDDVKDTYKRLADECWDVCGNGDLVYELFSNVLYNYFEPLKAKVIK